MRTEVYKVCPATAWEDALRLGCYRGSADDAADGFIHMSTAAQLPGTLDRHFSGPDGAGRTGLVLVSLDPARLGPSLRWEPARDGSLFPHLYGDLDPALAKSVTPLAVGTGGRHLLPGHPDRC